MSSYSSLFLLKHMAIAVSAVALCFLASCSQEEQTVQLQGHRDSLPTMRALDVSTLVSDSGITRYRATTSEWLVYTKVPKPYWSFPKGVRLEQFNTHLKTEANIYCNKAHYDMQSKLWQLDGDVKVTNIKGEKFTTQQLFWDQNQGKVYSKKHIEIHQKDCIIKGQGFESNSTMTHYVISHPEGIIPVSE